MSKATLKQALSHIEQFQQWLSLIWASIWACSKGRSNKFIYVLHIICNDLCKSQTLKSDVQNDAQIKLIAYCTIFTITFSGFELLRLPGFKILKAQIAAMSAPLSCTSRILVRAVLPSLTCISLVSFLLVPFFFRHCILICLCIRIWRYTHVQN